MLILTGAVVPLINHSPMVTYLQCYARIRYNRVRGLIVG